MELLALCVAHCPTIRTMILRITSPIQRVLNEASGSHVGRRRHPGRRGRRAERDHGIRYGMRRIKDSRQRLNITMAMVPPKFVRGSSRGAIVRSRPRCAASAWSSGKASSTKRRSRIRRSRLSAGAFRAACSRRAERSRSTRSNRARCGLGEIPDVSHSIRRYSVQRLGVRQGLHSRGLHADGGDGVVI